MLSLLENVNYLTTTYLTYILPNVFLKFALKCFLETSMVVPTSSKLPGNILTGALCNGILSLSLSLSFSRSFNPSIYRENFTPFVPSNKNVVHKNNEN